LGRFNDVRLSADGRWAVMPVFDQNHGTLDLWTLEVSTGVARRVPTWPATADSLVFSPDGRRIVYGKAYGRPRVLTMLSLQEGVVPEGDGQFPTDWSPDGRFIAETSVPRTHSSSRHPEVYLVDLARKSELVPLLVGPGWKSGVIFAPDGRSIAFLADDSGQHEVYVQPFDPEARGLTGTRRQISRGGASSIRWPKPGHELFYLGTDYWVYATTLTGKPERLFAIPQQTISMLHPPFGYDVAPGGKRFLLPAYRGDGLCHWQWC
jgi:Tol biopolymer transport system component